jgi:RND family efflux transporter MFP subunit
MTYDREDRPNHLDRARRYRGTFFGAVAVAAAFALATSTLWWKLHERSRDSTRVAAPASVRGDLNLPHKGQPDATPVAIVAANPQEPPLSPIQLSPQRMQSIGIQTGSVAYKEVEDELRFAGNVQVDERRLAYVQTRFAGWIRHLYVAATGEFVKRGQPLFTVYSPDLVTTEQEYLLAKRTQRELEGSSVDGVAAGAASLLSAAKARLQQWQVPARDIEKLEASGQVMTDLTIDSPASGYVIEKNALANMYVQPETRLYTLADLGSVWVNAQVFQNDAGKVKLGDHAEVTVDAYPGLVFPGKVAELLPQLDAATRTLPVRLELSNPGLKLRPGMYVNVRLRLPLGRHLVIPAGAAFQSGLKSLAFVDHGHGQIEPREIELGPRVGDDVVVAKGLSAGDVIVTSANFLIDSEAQLQAAAGAFAPPPPGAGAAAAMNTAANAQAVVELTTDPSPPRKGTNTVRVKVAGPDGKPLVGAEVKVTSTITATDQGGGQYVGNGELESGGTWQVTVTVRQQGRPLVTRHLAVNATGGM